MSEIEYCEECLSGKCNYHDWFTEANSQTENDVLITCLKYIEDQLDEVFEKVYITENSIHDWHEIIRVGGTLEFRFDEIPTVSKKDGKYIPLACYSFSDEIVDYDIVVEVMLTRHHPTDLVIKKNIFSEEEMYRVALIDSMDCLHCESIHDYPEIVKMAKFRLNNFIKRLQVENVDLKLEE